MRRAIEALTDELRRLRTAGVKNVAVSDEAMAALRAVIGASRPAAALPAAPAPPARRQAEDAAAARPAVTSMPVTAPAAAPTKAAKPASAKSALPEGVTPPPSAPPQFQLPEGDKAARWAALRELVLNDPVCAAHVRAGKKVVFGVGALDARIMFVGEAPGAEEEMQGEPFVGPAGQLLTKMIQGMGLKREDVYIGNIMNWRPEIPMVGGGAQIGNRAPVEEEMRYCLPYLRAQIEVVNPDLVVALGATAAQGLLGFGAFKALGEVRGKWHEFAGKPLMVTYHPSYILRNQSNRSKRMIWEDLLKVMERAPLPISDRQRAYFIDK